MWRKSTSQHFDLGAVISSLLKTLPLPLPSIQPTWPALSLSVRRRGGGRAGGGVFRSDDITAPRSKCCEVLFRKCKCKTQKPRKLGLAGKELKIWAVKLASFGPCWDRFQRRAATELDFQKPNSVSLSTQSWRDSQSGFLTLSITRTLLQLQSSQIYMQTRLSFVILWFVMMWFSSRALQTGFVRAFGVDCRTSRCLFLLKTALKSSTEQKTGFESLAS